MRTGYTLGIVKNYQASAMEEKPGDPSLRAKVGCSTAGEGNSMPRDVEAGLSAGISVGP